MVLYPFLASAFLQGLAGSIHCIGMCGPFVVMVHSRAAGQKLKASLAYNLSRSASYVLIGIAIGFLGKIFNLAPIHEFSSVVGGIFLLLYALILFFGRPVFGKPVVPPGNSDTQKKKKGGGLTIRLGRLLDRIDNPLLLATGLGAISGLLPCGLLYPAYSLALATGDPLSGGLVMLAFSLGTYPSLFSLGWVGARIWQRFSGRTLNIILGSLLFITGSGMLAMRAVKGGQHFKMFYQKQQKQEMAPQVQPAPSAPEAPSQSP